METDVLIDELMATGSDASRYRAVDSNGLLAERGSSTDDEMLDIATTAPVDYSDLADRSQGTSPLKDTTSQSHDTGELQCVKEGEMGVEFTGVSLTFSSLFRNSYACCH